MMFYDVIFQQLMNYYREISKISISVGRLMPINNLEACTKVNLVSPYIRKKATNNNAKDKAKGENNK
jgi:hypothetical protein